MIVGNNNKGIILSENTVEEKKINLIINGDLKTCKNNYMTPNVYQKNNNLIFVSKDKTLYNEYSKILNNFKDKDDMYQIRLLNFNITNPKTFYNPIKFACNEAGIIAFSYIFISSFSYVVTKPLNQQELLNGMQYLTNAALLYVYHYESEENKKIEIVKKCIDSMNFDKSVLDIKANELISSNLTFVNSFIKYYTLFKTLSKEVQAESISQIQKAFESFEKTTAWQFMNQESSITMKELISDKNALFIVPAKESKISDMFLFQFLSMQKTMSELALKEFNQSKFKLALLFDNEIKQFATSQSFDVFLYDVNSLKISDSLLSLIIGYNTKVSISLITDDEETLYKRLSNLNKLFYLFFEIVLDFSGETIYPGRFFGKQTKLDLKKNEINIFELSLDGNVPDLYMMLDKVYDYKKHINYYIDHQNKKEEKTNDNQIDNTNLINLYENINCHIQSNGKKNLDWKF
jgi:hypothetical protein